MTTTAVVGQVLNARELHPRDRITFDGKRHTVRTVTHLSPNSGGGVLLTFEGEYGADRMAKPDEPFHTLLGTFNPPDDGVKVDFPLLRKLRSLGVL
jgi:hypothetical protein